MQKKKQMLTDLEIDKVAFVPVGDNKGADISLFKAKPTDSAEGAPPESAPTREGDRKFTLKGFLEVLAKALGFKVEEADEHIEEASGNPDDDTAGGGGTNPPAESEEGAPTPNPSGEEAAKSTKGVDEEVKIDKSKFTPEELASYEALVAKAAVQDDPTPSVEEPAPVMEKAAEETPAQTETGTEDAYKGLNPVVAAELADLRKRADAAELRELTEVAKKYEILGKKPEELASTLKALKVAGGTAYDDMIAVLDSSLDAVEKSGAFSEVGKSGRSGETNDAWKQIEQHAADIQKAAPTLTRAQAIAKACEQHPELVAEYENTI